MNMVTGFFKRKGGDRSLALLDIRKILRSGLVTKRRHLYLRKTYLRLSAVLLEMSLYLSILIFSDRCCLKVDHKNILYTTLFVSMKTTYQLSPIRINERIGKRG